MNKETLLALLTKEVHEACMTLRRESESHEQHLCHMITTMGVIEACKEMYGEISGFEMDLTEAQEDTISDACEDILTLIPEEEDIKDNLN